MKLSILIVNWNVKDLLRRCLESLKRELDGNPELSAEVFLVDNASADGSVEMVATEFPWLFLEANAENRGFAAANNQVMTKAKGDFILLLNPDTEVKPGSLTTLLDFLKKHPKAGVVAPQLLNTDGSIQRSCREFPTFLGMLYELIGLSRFFPDVSEFKRYKMLDFDHTQCRQVDQPEGACLLLRKEVIEEVGILDEGYFMLFEEVDWCYRIKQAGWEIWFEPSSQVVHHYGQSIKQVKAKMILSSHRGLFRFWSKHYCGSRWYLRGFVYTGLMSLAYLRIAAFALRGKLNGQNASA